MKKLISEEKIKKKVKSLAKEIDKFYKNKDLVLVGFLKGSFIFIADLIREMKSNISIDFLEASSYGDGKISSGRVIILKDLSRNIQDKEVLIVEDIIDTGFSLNYLIEHLKKKKPKSIQICSLLLKESKHKVKIPILFKGFEIEDEFVVGYGMDYREKYRNLKYIGILQEDK